MKNQKYRYFSERFGTGSLSFANVEGIDNNVFPGRPVRVVSGGVTVGLPAGDQAK